MKETHNSNLFNYLKKKYHEKPDQMSFTFCVYFF